MKRFDLYSVKEYLRGDLFTCDLMIDLSTLKFKEQSRIDKLCELTYNSKVIHLGFADHIPLIEEKISENRWLHGRLVEKCKKCFGVDISQEAVDFVKQLGYNDILCADILKEDILLNQDDIWDYILLGEMLEHVDNPVTFLSKIRNMYGQRINRIIITVPNIFNCYNANMINKGIEHINSDHRYWFTPYTILKILYQSGFEFENIYFTNLCRLKKYQYGIRRLRKILHLEYKYNATYYDQIIVVAKF